MKNPIQRITNYAHRQYKRYLIYPNARHRFSDIKILDALDSIQYIIDNKCSLSRFGDGEVGLMSHGYSIGFQKSSEELRKRLIEVACSSDVPNHKLGFPYTIKDVRGLQLFASDYWGEVILNDGEEWLKYLRTNVLYLDTQISRFYKDSLDYNRSTKQINLLKKIWQDRYIVIVEGSQSRTGVGNDLYDNARQIERIIGYATDAFSRYDEMLSAIMSNVRPEDGKLILLSYGPTATVLAYDLAKLGYQAIDIGHVDIEYEWYLQKNRCTPVKNKYTNESRGGNVIDECNDSVYLQQIICDITK